MLRLARRPTGGSGWSKVSRNPERGRGGAEGAHPTVQSFLGMSVRLFAAAHVEAGACAERAERRIPSLRLHRIVGVRGADRIVRVAGEPWISIGEGDQQVIAAW